MFSRFVCVNRTASMAFIVINRMKVCMVVTSNLCARFKWVCTDILTVTSMSSVDVVMFS